eukprot:2533712-Rhodomonas_salina.2
MAGLFFCYPTQISFEPTMLIQGGPWRINQCDIRSTSKMASVALVTMARAGRAPPPFSRWSRCHRLCRYTGTIMPMAMLPIAAMRFIIAKADADGWADVTLTESAIGGLEEVVVLVRRDVDFKVSRPDCAV